MKQTVFDIRKQHNKKYLVYKPKNYATYINCSLQIINFVMQQYVVVLELLKFFGQKKFINLVYILN